MSYTIQVQTEYGPMLVPKHDINQTGALRATGRSPSHASIEYLIRLLRIARPSGGGTALDIGSNVGTYALALAPRVFKVLAFEPQRILCNMIAGSVALNGLMHVHVYNKAVGAKSERIPIPEFDYNAPLNFGSIEFGDTQNEQLSQPRQYNLYRKEYVEVITVDSLGLTFPPSVVKIDVEGMEYDVLTGAHQLLSCYRPSLLCVEWIKSGKHMLTELMRGYGYEVWQHGDDLIAVPSDVQGLYPRG